METTKALKTKPQNRNGLTILGSLFPKNVLMSQSLPKDNAPDNIKNKSTPHLKQLARMSDTNQLNEGMTAKSAKVT